MPINNNFPMPYQGGMPPSPRLPRSQRERGLTTSLHETHTKRSSSGPKNLVKRSNSATKSRTKKDEDNLNPSKVRPRTRKKLPDEENRDLSFVKLLQCGDHQVGKLGTRSAPPTLLLRGRYCRAGVSPSSSPVQRKKTLNYVQRRRRSGVSGVLKYFGFKRVSKIQEEELHQFRVWYNRLLQWRFVNARAQAAMAKVKIVAEADLLSVYDAMNAAMGVINNTEKVATKFLLQAEKICLLLLDLIITLKKQRESMEELEKWIYTIAALEARERSLRVNLVQAAKEEGEGPKYESGRVRNLRHCLSPSSLGRSTTQKKKLQKDIDFDCLIHKVIFG